jgi:hypothetical protein
MMMQIDEGGMTCIIYDKTCMPEFCYDAMMMVGAALYYVLFFSSILLLTSAV